jgi:hypothetical protein
LELSDTELNNLDKDKFGEWMTVMIDGIYSLVEGRLVIERRSDIRRARTAKPLPWKDEQLQEWLKCWEEKRIQGLVQRLQEGRPLRKKNFQYIVHNVHHGKWWPLVSVNLSHSLYKLLDGWLTMGWLAKPKPLSILTIDLEANSRYARANQQRRSELKRASEAGHPVARSLGLQYQPMARGHNALSPFVFGTGRRRGAVI